MQTRKTWRALGVLTAVCCWGLGGAVARAAPVTTTLQVGAEQRYDDDALLKEEDNGNGQLITKLSPQFDLAGKGESYKLDLFYNPDLLVHELTSRAVVNLDHKAGFALKKELGTSTESQVDLKFWRVSDPTSLPRLGVGRTLDPILYGTADLQLSTYFTRRWGLRVGHHFEGAKIYYQPNEIAPLSGAAAEATPGLLGGTCGTAGSSPSLGVLAGGCVTPAQASPGFANAPYAEAFYRLTRRAELGVGDREQFFNFGSDFAYATGPYAALRYRLSREANLAVTSGPVFFTDVTGTLSTDGQTRRNGSGVLPRATLDINRDGPQLKYGLSVGHDLVGASGFTNVLWADYASLYGSYRIFSVPLKLFGAVTYYRNGRTPDEGVLPLFSEGGYTSAGYALGAGAEYAFSKAVGLQGAYDRFDQVSNLLGAAQPQLTRNIVAARLNVTAW